MADGYWLSVELNWWNDNSAAAFEPMKVLRRLSAAFTGAEVNPVDVQRERLEWELAHWAHAVSNPQRRTTLIRSSWDLYATTGPTYTFVLPLASGVRVAGSARRLSVTFRIPPDVSAVEAEPFVAFLRSLGLGEVRRMEPMPVDIPATAAHRAHSPIDLA